MAVSGSLAGCPSVLGAQEPHVALPGLFLGREVRPAQPVLGRNPQGGKAPHVALGVLSH